MTIPGGLHAVFPATGAYGDVLRLLEYVYNDWFPESGYETKALPAYAVYRENHFVNESGEFELELCVPVRVG